MNWQLGDKIDMSKVPEREKPKPKVYGIYEMGRPMDRLVELWLTYEQAEAKVVRLENNHPRSDGYYIEEFELNGEL